MPASKGFMDMHELVHGDMGKIIASQAPEQMAMLSMSYSQLSQKPGNKAWLQQEKAKQQAQLLNEAAYVANPALAMDALLKGSPISDGTLEQVYAKIAEGDGKQTEAVMKARITTKTLVDAEQDVVTALAEGADPTSLGFKTARDRLGGVLASEQNRIYSAAQTAWVESALRYMSGANTPISEYEQYEKMYFPKLGDTEAVIRSKRLRRENFMKAVSDNAGQPIQTVADAAFHASGVGPQGSGGQAPARTVTYTSEAQRRGLEKTLPPGSKLVDARTGQTTILK